MKKLRDSEEMDELERERQELIHSQAVKKNPGIATRWWNPPLIKTVEEELDPDQLESHRKYQERKQKKLESTNLQQELPAETDVSFILVEVIKKEDHLLEQMNFSTTQNQLQLEETTNETKGLQTEATNELCSGKLFSGGAEAIHILEKASEVKTQSVDDDPADISNEQARIENEFKERKDMQENCGDFTCAQTVVTLPEDPESSANSSCHNEEIDSGLDDLSVQSQDTTPQEGLSMDNMSDSGASNEATNAFLESYLGDCSLPATPQATSPINTEIGGSTAQSESSMSPSYPGTSLAEEPSIAQSESSISPSYTGTSLAEEHTEYHTIASVQNAIQQACQTVLIESQEESLPNPDRYEEVHDEIHLGESLESNPQICDSKSKYNPPQVSSPVPQKHEVAQEVAVKTPPVSTDTFWPLTIGGGQSPQTGDKQEFSYFSKYSDAAELRSTALTQPRETKVSSGPFRLRSHKQRTLCLIEEEIRAAEEREQELKRQRQTRGLNTVASHKERTGNIPTRLVVTAKTAPGEPLDIIL